MDRHNYPVRFDFSQFAGSAWMRNARGSGRPERNFLIIIILALANILWPIVLSGAALAATALVSWDRNPEPDIAGYTIFYGTSSGAYTESVPVDSPDQLSCEISGLFEGNTYYFAVKAMDLAGQESPFSLEVSKHFPLPNLPPSAAIQVSALDGTAPLTVHFDAGASSDPDGTIAGYSWQFGDGGSDTGVLSSHTYITEGNMTVSLTVTDNAGVSDTATVQIQVGANQPPVPRISASTMSGFAPLSLAVDAGGSTDADGTIVEYTWDLGDGTTAEGVSATHIFENPGSYTVVLMVTDDKGAVASTDITVEARSGYLHTWLFGDNSLAHIAGTAEDASITLDAQNTAESEILVTYTWPTDQPANAILMKWNLSAIPPGAEIREATVGLFLEGSVGESGDALYDISAHRIVGVDPMLSLCTGFTYDGVHEWTANTSCYEGIPLAQADIEAASHITAVDTVQGIKTWNLTAMAQHWVTAPAENFGVLLNADTEASEGSNRAFVSSDSPDASKRPVLTVTFVADARLDLPPRAVTSAAPARGTAPLPVTFDGTSSLDPEGDIVVYHWAFGDGEQASGPVTSHTFNTPGTFTATLTVSDAAGASDTASVVIEVLENIAPVAVMAAEPAEGVAPLDTRFDGTGSYDQDGTVSSYSWDLGDGTRASGDVVLHTYGAPGVYTVVLTVTDDRGATAETSALVTVMAPNSAPVIESFSASQTVLDNPMKLVTFDATVTDPEGDPLGYLLDFGNGETATQLPVNYKYRSSGVFEAVLTVTDTAGHEATATVTIVVNDAKPKVPTGVKVAVYQ